VSLAVGEAYRVHTFCYIRIIIKIIIITDLYNAFRSEDTEAVDATQED